MAYSTVILADSPLAYWPLDETVGTTAADSSGNSRTLTRTNGFTSASGLLPNGTGVNSTLLASASSQYLEIADAAWEDLTSGWSLEAWVKPTTLVGTDTIISKLGTNASYYVQAINGTGEIEFAFYTGATYTGYQGCFAPVGSLKVGRTSHIVCTYDGATMKIWVDNALVGTASKTGNAYNSADPLRIGAGNVTNYWDGRIDEVAIYNTVLSPTQISTHFVEGCGGVYEAEIMRDKPVSYWPATEGSGDAIDCQMIQAGTYTNAPTRRGDALPSNLDYVPTFVRASDQYIRVTSNAAHEITAAISVECWFIPVSQPGASVFYNVFSKRATSTSGSWLMNYCQSTGFKVGLENYANATSQGWYPLFTCNSEFPYHMVGTCDGTTQNIYVNGVNVGGPRTMSSTGNVGDGGPGGDVILGSDRTVSGANSGFDGGAGHFAVYDYVLSVGQIADHYAAGLKSAMGMSLAGGRFRSPIPMGY